MLLFEEHALALLVVHSFLALATVALTTHLAFWLRRYLRRRASRKSVIRFAILSTSAYGLTMILGMALYPTYKVRVRAEYLDNPSRIHRANQSSDATARQTEAYDEQVRKWRQGMPPETSPVTGLRSQASTPSPEELGERGDDKVTRGAKIVRWFDVKEHWAVLGFLLSLATCGIILSWKPNEHGKAIGAAVTGLAMSAAAISWAAAIIGIVTAAARSVAAL